MVSMEIKMQQTILSNQQHFMLVIYCFLLATFHQFPAAVEGKSIYQLRQDDFYGSGFKKEDLKEIPRLGDANPQVNLAQLQTRSWFWLSDLIKADGFNNTVFKVTTFREKIVLADPIAIQAVYDTSKVEKVTELLGLLDFNTLATRGYLPSLIDNGKSHATKKRRQYKFVTQRLRKIGYEGIFRIMKEKFGNQAPVDSDTSVNFEDIVEDIARETQSEFLLGKSLTNRELWRNWFSATFKIVEPLDPNPGANDAVITAIADKMFAFVETTPVIQALTGTRSQKELLTKEIMFVSLWLGTKGNVEGAKSAIARYYELSDAQRDEVNREARAFFRKINKCYKTPEEEREVFKREFKRLKALDDFMVEVFRHYPHVTQINVRATKDFVLTSQSGRFQIKKDQFLTAEVTSTQRNPNVFKEPETFDNDRKVCHTKKNFYAFGGAYAERATVHNHKCIGQKLGMDFIKMFVLLMTRCEVDITSDLKFTRADGTRSMAIDELMMTKKFKCKIH